VSNLDTLYPYRRWLASVLHGHYVLRSAEQPGSTWRLLKEMRRIWYRRPVVAVRGIYRLACFPGLPSSHGVTSY
jgi:hypothetical protein